MKTFYLFRHALARLPGQHYGGEILTASIIPEGRQAIEKMATYLGTQTIDSFQVSPLKRCLQTAQIISKQVTTPYVVDKRLSEYSPEHEADLGETFSDFNQRLVDLTRDLFTSSHLHVAICTHGAVIAGLSHTLLQKPFDLSQLEEYPSPGVLWILKDGHIQEMDFNATV